MIEKLLPPDRSTDVRVSTGRVKPSHDGSCLDNTAVLTLRVNYDDLRRGDVSHTSGDS